MAARGRHAGGTRSIGGAPEVCGGTDGWRGKPRPYEAVGGGEMGGCR